MKEKDVAANEFFRDNRRFADVMNVGLFHGKKILQEEALKPVDGFSGSLERKSEKKTAVSEFRDVIKRADFGVNFALLGVENQSDIHYAMPIRIMGYDYLSYKDQWRRIQKEHRKKKDLGSKEFLSGFSKKDQLHLTITLVIYYGNEPWDGPTRLSEMLNWEEIPEELREFVTDYPVYILDVKRFREVEQLHTDVRLVFGFLQRQERKEALLEYIEENQQEFSDIPEDTYDMLDSFGNVAELETIKKLNRKEKGGIDMCKALQDMREDAKNEGIEIGKAEGRLQAQIRLIVKKVKKGKSLELIADELESTTEELRHIYETVCAFAPEYDDVRIYQALV